MLTIRERFDAAAPVVTFDWYVPVTIAWDVRPASGRPLLGRWEGEGVLLDLAFDPDRGALLEATLIMALGVRRVAGAAGIGSADPYVEATLEGDPSNRQGLRASARDDGLIITAGTPTRWVGSEPVLLGVTEADEVVALRVAWAAEERDEVLAGVRAARESSAGQR